MGGGGSGARLVTCSDKQRWVMKSPILGGQSHTFFCLNEAVTGLRALYSAEPEFLDELDGEIRPDDPPEGRGSGYVVDCLHSARWAVAQGGYEQCVKAAIGLGNDTDTTACIAGDASISGCRNGVPESAIPAISVSRGNSSAWLIPA